MSFRNGVLPSNPPSARTQLFGNVYSSATASGGNDVHAQAPQRVLTVAGAGGPEGNSGSPYKCFMSVARVPIPMQALVTLLLDAPGRRKWDPSLRVCEVVGVLDRTLDITYARYPGLDFCSMRKLCVQHAQQRVIIASQSIAEDPAVFCVPPHGAPPATAPGQQGVGPHGVNIRHPAAQARTHAPPPLQAPEEEDNMSPIRVQLRGTGFIVQPLGNESLLTNVLQIRKDEWMHPAVVDQIARQRIALTIAMQQHYTSMLVAEAAGMTRQTQQQQQPSTQQNTHKLL